MYLISYDIENDRLRLRLSKLLLRWGLHRMQYSVFLGPVDKQKFPNLLRELQQEASKKEWTSTDSILMIPVHQTQVKAIRIIGTWPERWEEITGEANTLIL